MKSSINLKPSLELFRKEESEAKKENVSWTNLNLLSIQRKYLAIFLFTRTQQYKKCVRGLVPQTDGSIGTRASKRCPIWAKRDAEHLSRMASECSFVFPSAETP